MNMLPRERFLTALAGGQPDRVPVWDWVNNPAVYRHVLGEAPAGFDGRLAVRLLGTLGLDACWVPVDGFMGLPSARWRWAGSTTYVDEWATGYQVGEGSWPLAFVRQHPVRTPEDWARLPRPDPEAAWRQEYLAAALGETRREPAAVPAVVAGVRGPFSSAWMLMGLEQMSYALADYPELLDDIFRVTADFWAIAGLAAFRAGADAIVIHDDQGSNTATFFAPARWRQLVLPHLARQIATLRAAGAPVILHSCGNINAILPDLVATGINGLNNLQRAARMDLAAVKAAYGPKLCLIGNVDATNLMPAATPAEVEAAVRECLRIASPGGGYILATDHSFHEGIPVENVLAFIEAGHKYGAYPHPG